MIGRLHEPAKRKSYENGFLVDVHGEVSAAPGVGVAGAELVAARVSDAGALTGALVAAEALQAVLHAGVEVPGLGAVVQASGKHQVTDYIRYFIDTESALHYGLK